MLYERGEERMGRIWPRADEWKLQWWELREFHTDSDDPEVLALVASLNDLQKGQARRIRVARRIGFWTVLPFLALTFYLMGLTEDGFLLRESLARAGEGIFLGITVALLVILARRWYLFREGEVIHLQERREHIFKELEDRGLTGRLENFVRLANQDGPEEPVQGSP